MAEEEDDDESFGDFTFASFPNQPFPSTSDHTNPLDDDDWGDFVNHSNQINGAVSKPFDPFPPSLDSTDKHLNDNNGIVVQPKKKGAIPLSIFGVDEEEEEEEEPASSNVFADKSNGAAVKARSDTNGSVGISDLISTLYSQHPQMNSQNGSISISNVAAPNSSADGLTNSKASKLNSDSEDEDGWEFKSAEWETGVMSQHVKSEVPKHGNGSIGAGTMMDSTTGISDKSGGWHLEFDFIPSSASQDHISPQQLGPKSESNVIGTGFPMFNQILEPSKMANIYPTNMEVHKYDGAAPHHTIDSSLASESHQSDEWGFGFSFNSGFPGEHNHSSESYFSTKNSQDDNINNSSPTNMNTDSDVNLFESKDAITESGTKPEKPLISSENHREALPLSIFGDEMPDTDELSVSQDLSPCAPTSPIRNGFNSPGSNLSINDLIWNLYSQAENKVSPNVTSKASDHQIHASPEVSGSSLVTSGDNFDDDLWDCKDALPGTRFSHESAQKNSFNHAPLVNESSSTTVLNSDLTNADDDFEDDSWEFKDAISGTSQDQASALDHQDLPPIQLSTKLELIDYIEFYSKLKDELCNYVMFHLQNIKNARSVAALSGEDSKAKALQEEIQEFSKTLHQNNMSIPNEYLLEDYSPRNACFDEILELLKEPKFQPLESEYQLASRLSMVNKDIKSALELLENTASTLRILKLGSREEQSNYLTIWSKIAFVCSQELKHGAYIWKQAVQKGVNNQILSNPKGKLHYDIMPNLCAADVNELKQSEIPLPFLGFWLTGVQYIHAIGEIYRVAEIIGASAKLYKPWILSDSMDPKSLFAPLNECYSIWLASGLKEALFSISNQNNFEPDNISREIVESIKYIHELDEHAHQRYVISGEQTTCQLSALPAGLIPGLNLVTWNGKHYFVKLANLWVNLISSDPPKK